MLVKILILDDEDKRHAAYNLTYAEHKIENSYNYIAFLDALYKDSPWDLIHLDHDLGDHMNGDTYEDGWGVVREFNGVHAASKICELEDKSLPKAVIIHSLNPVGSQVMLNMIKQRGISVEWQPFKDQKRI